MASHVFVVDATARRHQIKTTPNKYLRDILEEACQKFNKDPEQFILTDNGRPAKTLDLSRTVRLAGLASGARLQLVQSSRSPAVLSVALQLPPSLDGQRLQDRFPSNTSLWLVLRKFEEAVAGGKKMNITQRGAPSTDNGSGRLEYEQPVVNVMGRDFGDFADLQKTLLQLGFNSGSVLLRLKFRNSGIPMQDAMAQISEYFVGVQTTTQSPPTAESHAAKDAHGAHAMPEGTFTSIPDASAPNAGPREEDSAAKDPSGDTVMTPPPPTPKAEHPYEEKGLIASSSEGPIQQLTETSQPDAPSDLLPEEDRTAHPAPSESTTSEPQIAVYRPSSNTTPFAAQQSYNASDFEPSVEHAQAHQAVLNRASQNKRLLSDAEMAKQDEARQQQLATVKTTILRVRFPDQMMTELTITTSDDAASLYSNVQSMLERPEEAFQLRYTGPKGAPVTIDPKSNQKLIRGLGMAGRVLVTMVWDVSAGTEARESPVLKESLRGQAQELKIAAISEVTEEKGKGKSMEQKPGEKQEKKSKGDVEARMKKFLGFGKK